MIRKSSKGDPSNPYSLSVWYDNRCWNLQIRLRTDQMYALGTEKSNELVYVNLYYFIEKFY